MLDVSIHFQKLPKGINKAGDHLSFGQEGLKHHGAKALFTVQ